MNDSVLVKNITDGIKQLAREHYDRSQRQFETFCKENNCDLKTNEDFITAYSKLEVSNGKL